VKIILKYKADIESGGDDNPKGYTPLFMAAATGHVDVLSYLVENGADVKSRLIDNLTPLMLAILNSQVNTAVFLIEHGAKLDIRDRRRGYTAAHYAAFHYSDSCDVLSCLIKNGADVNARASDNSLTPVMLAITNGYLNAAVFLIKYVADVNVEGSDGKTALHYAVQHYDSSHHSEWCEVFSCLIKNGADINACAKGNNTPLMSASSQGNLNAAMFLIKHGADVNVQDRDGKTALHYAVPHRGSSHHFTSCEVFSCLVENGANVNSSANDSCTPLMLAISNGHLNGAIFLTEHGTDVNVQDRGGKTALHYAVQRYNSSHHSEWCEVLSCLVENGADVNARENNDNTPLMIASFCGHVNVVTFLIQHGADLDFQNNRGSTALHFAVTHSFSEIVHILLDHGASHLYNNRQLTPLLCAINNRLTAIVEELIRRPEFTKEQRIEALELLGASLGASVYDANYERAFQYMKRGMEERFQDPCHPLMKQTVEHVEPHQDRRESQTLEELAQIEGDVDAICMEGLFIKERILGSESYQFLNLIRSLATRYERSRKFDACLRLHRYAREINQRHDNHSALITDIQNLKFLLYNMIRNNFSLRQNVVLEVLQETVHELAKGHDAVSVEKLDYLVDYTVQLLQIFASDELFEEDKNPCILATLKTLVGTNLQNSHGSTLLHLAADGQHRMEFFLLTGKNPSPLFAFPCAKTVKLLLQMGFNINAVNRNGDTPLHRAVTFKPSRIKRIHLLTDTLEVLLDEGAHHDFVNNDGKTAMDMAQTVEACRVLSERKTLELKCIATKAMKKFGLPYLGVVPKMVAKYISMH